MSRTYSLEEVGAEIAPHIKDPKQFLRRKIKAGQIRARKVGRTWVMTEADIEAALEVFANTTTESEVAPAISLTAASLRRRRSA